MPKAKPVPEPQVEEMAKQLPSAGEFREAVKFALTHDHGMPPLYAEEVLDGDPEFVERHRQSFFKSEGAVARAADGLRFEPPKGLKWVALSPGQRLAEADQVVLNADGAVGRYLDSLVALGLHGPDRDTVASSMLAKGIESVFPLIATNMVSNASPTKSTVSTSTTQTGKGKR